MTRLTLATLAVVAIVVARRARVRDEVEDDAGDLRERALSFGRVEGK